MGTHIATMVAASAPLTLVTSVRTSSGPEDFMVMRGIEESSRIKDKKDGSEKGKDVGPKLAAALDGHYEAWSESGWVRIFRVNEPVREELPFQLMKETGRHYGLSWRALLTCINDLPRGLRASLITGSQLGCLVRMPGGNRVIRVKLDWEEGHSLGFRPSEPSWAWNAGTFFARFEPN